MRLLQRKIIFRGEVLGEVAYLGYADEADGTVVRFLLDTYLVHSRPMSDVIGKGKMFEIEFVAVEREKGFKQLFIIKQFLPKNDSALTSTTGVVVRHPKTFLSIQVRKMQQEMGRAWKEGPIEEPAF